MIEDLTTHIVDWLNGQRSLEDHEVKMPECLLQINPTINRQIVLIEGNFFYGELMVL